MSGFKDGAASSGLGGDKDEDDEQPAEDQLTDSSLESESDSLRHSTESTSDETGGGLPWLYQRSEITDGRAKTVQLHLQQDTIDEEFGTKSEIEELLGETVKKADLREAAYLVGLSHLDQVASQLREWGYDIE